MFVYFNVLFSIYFSFLFCTPMHKRTGENVLGGGIAKIARRILLHKNMLMIRRWLTFYHLFLPTLLCLRNKKQLSLWLWKQSHFCVKWLVLIGMQLIKVYKSIVNVLIKTISDKTFYKLRLTKILKKRLFDQHPITFK